MQEDGTDFSHTSVLLQETLAAIDLPTRTLVVDATLGLGGHSAAMLSGNQDVSVLAIEQDPEAIAIAGKKLGSFGPRVTITAGNFENIAAIVQNAGIGRPDAVIADLGVSSLQFDSAERGFSFRFDAPLDMRMDARSGGQTAADLLRTTPEGELADLIYKYGEERASRRIAKWIVEKNDAGEPIETTRQLAELVSRAVKHGPKDKIHPATRTFQALRIVVNRELEVLEKFVADAVSLMGPSGILAIITFHSLEDRIVKHLFQKLSGKCSCPPRIPQCMCGATKTVQILTRKPTIPNEAEMSENPRSRSAKLRACKKLN